MDQILYPPDSLEGEILYPNVFDRFHVAGDQDWAIDARMKAKSDLLRLSLALPGYARNFQDLRVLDLACGHPSTILDLISTCELEIRALLVKTFQPDDPSIADFESHLDAFRRHEPWTARVLAALGAEVVGVDKVPPYLTSQQGFLEFMAFCLIAKNNPVTGSIVRKAFEISQSLPREPDPTWTYVQADLTQPDPLPLEGPAFDVVTCNLFLGEDWSHRAPEILAQSEQDPAWYQALAARIQERAKAALKPGGVFLLNGQMLRPTD